MSKRILCIVFVTIVVAVAEVLSFSVGNSKAISLCGAFTAFGRGINCIGFNPANLALSSPGEVNLMMVSGVNYLFTNNAFSLESYSQFAGKNVGVYGDSSQEEIAKLIPGEGWKLYSSLEIPVVRVSLGNKAFSSDLMYIRCYNFSKSIFEVVFGDIQPGEEYRYRVKADEIIAFKHGFSLGLPFGKLCVGVTISYIQALSGFKVDPVESSGYIVVDTANFVLTGEGSFRLTQYVGGEGFAMDFGLLYHDLYGWDVGIGFINAGGVIRYNSQHILSRLFAEKATRIIEKNFNNTNKISELDFDGTVYEYSFKIRGVNVEKLVDSDSTLKDFFLSERKVYSSRSKFSEKIPLVLRVGVFKSVGHLNFSMDFVSTFDDGFIYKKGWEFASGFEYDRGKGFPVRAGFSIGGIRGVRFGLGSGIRKGFVVFDWGLNFHRGLFIHKLKGIDLSLSLYLKR